MTDSLVSSETIPIKHRTHRIGWLRAAVLGANDGILSVGSLIAGVAAAHVDRDSILIAGVAGLVAGAMSMASGEYVSVSSQADTEKADLADEQDEHIRDIRFEHRELAEIYVKRGLNTELAQKVATQLMAHDALGAHARDELGISDVTAARPVQAALASAASFFGGASLPLLTVLVTPVESLVPVVSVASLFFLAILGAAAAHTGGASRWRGALRVTFWGALALALTSGIGALVGRVV